VEVTLMSAREVVIDPIWHPTVITTRKAITLIRVWERSQTDPWPVLLIKPGALFSRKPLVWRLPVKVFSVAIKFSGRYFMSGNTFFRLGKANERPDPAQP